MYNFHMHSTFCDGDNTPEEMLLSAIEKGMKSIGFSGHGYTQFDLRYCMKDTDGYIAEIKRLQAKYRDKIQIYIGVEEDAFYPVDRSKFDYIIGSSHYIYKQGNYYPIDSSYEYFQKCMELFQHDVVAFAESYYSAFCDYIVRRKPNIVGHFDLITKYDELDTSVFFANPKYNEVAERNMKVAAESNCIFEVNTGAISRGLRTTVYPSEKLLHVLRKQDARIILSSDSHSAHGIDFGFEETKAYLRDIGFRYAFTLLDNEWKKYEI